MELEVKEKSGGTVAERSNNGKRGKM